jgi:hypothetical protein
VADAAENVFGVQPVEQAAGAILGKDREGRPAILLQVAAGETSKRPVLNLTHLLVRHNATCIGVAERVQSALPTKVTLIRCKSSDRVLQQHFLQIVAVMLQDFTTLPTSERVDSFIRKLAQLFRALERPALRTIQGLWSELFVMARSQEPLTMLRAWHRSPYATVDFSDGAQRLEVKSFREPPRSHTFSLAQLSPPKAATIVVASIQAVPEAGGATIHDLLQELRAIVGHDDEAATHLEETAAACLGDGWREALREGFDVERAADTLSFYASGAIPSVATPLPDAVSNVHFDALMTGVLPLGVAELGNLGTLFAATAPTT